MFTKLKQNKYKLDLNDKKQLPNGIVVYRIIAEKDVFRTIMIDNQVKQILVVSKGTKGGYVASNKSIPQNDSSWVFDDAIVATNLSAESKDFEIYDKCYIEGNVCLNKCILKGGIQVRGNVQPDCIRKTLLSSSYRGNELQIIESAIQGNLEICSNNRAIYISRSNLRCNGKMIDSCIDGSRQYSSNEYVCDSNFDICGNLYMDRSDLKKSKVLNTEKGSINIQNSTLNACILEGEIIIKNKNDCERCEFNGNIKIENSHNDTQFIKNSYFVCNNEQEINVLNSEIKDSTLKGNCEIVNVRHLYDSTIMNSNIESCSILNSELTDKKIFDCEIRNSIAVEGEEISHVEIAHDIAKPYR